DDALSPEERARVRAHLSTCAACSAVLTAYETMYATLQQAVAPVPADLRRNVYARIAEMEARPNARPPVVLALLTLLRSAGATAGLLAVLAALLAALVRLGGPLHASAPVAAPAARGISTAGTTLQPGHAAPIPTIPPAIPAGDGLVYVHLSSVPAGTANAGASRGEFEFHAFARGGWPRPLVTPGPSPEQVVTGLSASRDGDAITYAVEGRGNDGGIFHWTIGTPQPTKVLASDSGPLLNGAARLLGQVSSGPTPHGQTSHLGVGQVLGRHPVWAPDGRSILFLQGTALALWSARDSSVRRLVTPDPADHEFISAFAWAPGGRFFAYVVSSPDPHGTSTVWLGDTQGHTWKSFARRWIGAIAWVHGRAFQPTATPTSATPTPPLEMAAGVTPTPYDNTTTPVDVLQSFINAISRHDFRRAYSYLSYTDGRSLRQFTTPGYANTSYDEIVRLLPAPYLTPSHAYVLTCVGIQLLAHNKNGQTVRYGGWYLVKNTTGQNPHFAGWRIQMPGTHIKRGGAARVPPQARCVPPPTPTHSAG
ncbi:MAG TPA: anti-sigma factor, partial [Chloroflexota bacterium]|nr:anti-sigma factor [Chloroflexota bacterium]